MWSFSIVVFSVCVPSSGVARSYGRFICSFLGNLHTVFPEKAMAPHSSTPAWKIPWIEEPGRLQSTGSLRVGHDWSTLLSLFTFMHWKRKWQPTPVFLPGESHRGAWWAAVYGVAQSRTWLKWLSSSSILFSIIAVSVYMPTNSAGRFLFSTSFPAVIICWLFYHGHSDWYEVILRCSFDLHFSNN